jgi:hypothetical protein
MPSLGSIRNVLAGAILLAVSAQPALSADYKGTMDFGCCGTEFRLRVLQHPKGKRTPEKEIILQLHQGCPGRIPLEMMVPLDQAVQAELCEPSSKHCETATAGKIHLDSLSKNGKHASGSFTADFPNAGHEEGKFTVKYHHEGPKYICE